MRYVFEWCLNMFVYIYSLSWLKTHTPTYIGNLKSIYFERAVYLFLSYNGAKNTFAYITTLIWFNVESFLYSNTAKKQELFFCSSNILCRQNLWKGVTKCFGSKKKKCDYENSKRDRTSEWKQIKITVSYWNNLKKDNFLIVNDIWRVDSKIDSAYTIIDLEVRMKMNYIKNELFYLK